MNLKAFFEKNWMHFAVLGLFIMVTLVYFSPEFDGYDLKQHDVEQHKGMSNEIVHFRENNNGEEPMWTNSMFGGMPAVQISMLYHGNIFQRATIGFLKTFGVPSGIFFLHLIGFYILALCLRIKPLIAVVGAFAFAFASYEIIILQAGHNSKAIAVAYMAPVLGAFLMAYRINWKWGALLSAFFMTWEISANHLQVTYYLGILLFFLGLYEMIKALRGKKIKQFGITSACIIGAYLLALFINYGNISLTNDYAKHTIRGGNDVTINSDGTASKIATSGLDKDYITTWSYGIGESFTLVSPYVKGGASMPLGMSQFSELAQSADLSREELNQAMNMSVYYGEQPIVSGPTYLGVIVLLLAFLGLVFLEDKSKWVLFGVAVLALMLAWGKNFMGLTEFFIDNIPGYNKFRTVTIIMVLIELIIPIIGVMFLQKLYEERERLNAKKKTFLIATGGFVVFLVLVKMIGLGDNYTSQADKNRIEQYRSGMMNEILNMPKDQLKQNYGVDASNKIQLNQFLEAQLEPVYKGMDGIKKVRKEIFSASMTRSILFSIVGAGILALFFFTSFNPMLIIGGIGVMVLLDLVMVDVNYLGKDTLPNGEYKHWVSEAEATFPMISTPADDQIMEREVAQNPLLKSAIENGRKQGERKADELGYTGKEKRRVVRSYEFAALNANTNYRVFDIDGGWGSARASYFHKSLGGYHGAKLRNIQNLFEFQIAQSNNKVLDMLNVKYFIQQGMLRPNNTVMGNAWFVKNVEKYDVANDEIRALGNKFSLINQGNGRLLINGEATKEAEVYGGELIDYITKSNDTLKVPLPNGINEGMKVMFVEDVNGQTDLIPAITLDVDTNESFNELVSINLLNAFNPKDEAVMLSSEAKRLSTTKFDGKGNIELVSYAPNRLVYKANTNGKELAVFSEIYYNDGWKAYVDGKEQDILKVNYLLRGLELDKGEHKIEFVFDIPQLHTSNLMSVIGTVILFLALGGMFFYERKKQVKKDAA